MLHNYEFVEWNDPFTGYDYDDYLLQRLRLEYEQNAIHDKREKRLQERIKLGAYQEKESRERQGPAQCGEVQGGS